MNFKSYYNKWNRKIDKVKECVLDSNGKNGFGYKLKVELNNHRKNIKILFIGIISINLSILWAHFNYKESWKMI